MELLLPPHSSFCFNQPLPPVVPPFDLTKPLSQEDLTFNFDLRRNDTERFSSFARAVEVALRLVRRQPLRGDPGEVDLVEAFLHAERLFEEQTSTDPRIPYLFAELLIRLDDYDYSLNCLKVLEAMLKIPSPAVASAISAVQQMRAERVRTSQQGRTS
jgi:hypothetical protein